ncbi:MAG: MlaD family protein [Syntrophothermus sp.]
MKDQRKSEIKVGIMVIVGLIIFIWIFGWAKNFSLKSDEKHLTIKFDDVAGLEVGDNVTINGVRKGYVEDFNVHSEDVLVKVKLDPDVDLREDAVFAVSMLDLMGGKKVDIKPGISKKNLDYNKIQYGVFNADIPFVMSMAGSLNKDLPDIMNDVKKSLQSLNTYLNDEKINREIKNSVSNLSEITDKLNILISENRTNINRLSNNSVKLTDDAISFLNENRQSMTNAINDINKVIVQADSLLKKINSIAAETTERNNNMGKLLYDEQVFNDLKETLIQAKELTKIINEQLKSDGLKVNADVDIF